MGVRSSDEARRGKRGVKCLLEERPCLCEVVSGSYRWLLLLVCHVALEIISASLVLENRRRINILILARARPLQLLLRVESLVRPWSRHLSPRQLLLAVVEARLGCIEAGLV